MSQTNTPASLPEDAKYAERQDPIIRLDLPAGPVYCVLFPDAAPKHVERILTLASPSPAWAAVAPSTATCPSK